MERTTRIEKTPVCSNCGTNLTMMFRPYPVDVAQGRFVLVMPAFECASCGERVVMSADSPEHDARLPGAMIYANY